MPSQFEERYAGLNPEQKEAVDTTEGSVMVIAGPGTGKTEILTMRVANILRSKKIAPEKIFALTFTEAGAINMRRRLVELIGQDAYRVEISTFHGFANRIIKDYPDYFPNIVGSFSITEIDQVKIMRKLLDETKSELLRPFGDRYLYLKDILSAIDELKRQAITPEAFATIATEEKKTFYANPDLFNTKGKFEGKMKGKYASAAKRIERNLELVELYSGYQKALITLKQYDYSDMILYVAMALGDSDELLSVLQSTYEYFLVDEHQDTNDAQNKIIELLASLTDQPNLFVVGDEKQAIFRFQGASIENFHYFEKKYKGVKLIHLESNYRSTQAILNAAQIVSPRETQLVAKSGHKESPAHLAALSAPDLEYFFIARKIKELIAGAPPEEIAVIYHENRDVTPLVQMLSKEGVAFNIESNQDVLGDVEIKKLIRILRAVQHFDDSFAFDWALGEALGIDFLGIEPLEVYKISIAAKREHRKIYDVLRDEKGLPGEFFRHLSEWKRAADNQGAVEAFETIVRDSGFLAHILKHPSATEKIAKLHTLFDLIKTFVEREKNYTLRDFFTYLDLMEEHGVAVKSTETVRLPGRVRLMTAHRSKGLEFDYVFIMNAIDRKWGSRKHRQLIKLPDGIYRGLEVVKTGMTADSVTSETEDEDAEEAAAAAREADERNVFYVALTRARREVFVTMSKTDREGKEQIPTQFISELKPDILAPLDVAKYEEEFAARRGEIEFAPPAPKIPELADKEFLNALFDEQGLSVTALNNYLECPWHYFYVNLIRIPEAPNKHLSFGNAIHAALKSYFDAFAQDDMAKLAGGSKYLVARFEEALAGEPIKESDYEEALEKGRRALPTFYENYHLDWSPNAINEARIDGVATSVANGNVKLKGNLDRIEFLDGGSAGGVSASGPVRVIDYKTGKQKSRNDIEGNTKSSDGNYKRQLVFYKLLLDKEGKYDMKEGVIQFIEPDERGKFRREVFEIAPNEVAELEKQVGVVAQEIRSLSFFDRGCEDPDCHYCELRKMSQ